SCLPAVVCEGWVFRGQPLSLGRTPWDGTNSQKATHLCQGAGAATPNAFASKRRETKISLWRSEPSFSVKERGSNGAFTLFAIFCLKSFVNAPAWCSH